MGVLPPPIEPTRAPANLSLPAFSLFYDRPSRISLTRWSSDNCTRRCRWSRRALSVYTAITDLFQPDSFFSTFFHRDFPPISGKKVERVISFQDGTKRRRCYFYSSVRSIRNSLAHRVYISVHIRVVCIAIRIADRDNARTRRGARGSVFREKSLHLTTKVHYSHVGE